MSYRSNHAAALLALALIGAAGHACAEQPLSVFARAIGGGVGAEARGEMTGPGTDFIKTTTHSDAPILIHAKTLVLFKQQGCARIAWELTQVVPRTDGKTATFLAPYRMSICVDGTIPVDAPDTVEYKKQFNLFSFFEKKK